MKKGQLYHTALADGEKVITAPASFYGKNDSLVFQLHLLTLHQLPSVYERCGILYTELPFPQGFKVFNERAGVKEEATYKHFITHIDKLVVASGKPALLIAGKVAMTHCVSKVGWFVTKIRGTKAFCAVYGEGVEWANGTDEEIIKDIAIRYDCVGDFACGYGRTGRTAWEYGKSFIMSDYNRQCVGVCKGWMQAEGGVLWAEKRDTI